jgi:hypothetical protein
VEEVEQHAAGAPEIQEQPGPEAESSEPQGMQAEAREAEPLELFTRWLSGLVDDGRALSKLVVDPAQPEAVRGYAAGALSYLLHASDVVCAGVEDLAWVDVALMVRVSAQRVARHDPALLGGEAGGLLKRLAGEAEPAARFLGDLGPGYERSIELRASREVRGRTLAAIVAEPELAAALAVEVETWAARFEPPALAQSKYELVKLRAFLQARA